MIAIGMIAIGMIAIGITLRKCGSGEMWFR
jgi:hypothetical protein